MPVELDRIVVISNDASKIKTRLFDAFRQRDSSTERSFRARRANSPHASSDARLSA